MNDNAAQADIWNGPQGTRWAGRAARAEYRLANVHAALMLLAAPQPGEDVLDVGCGCGATTCELAAAAAPGHATGLDISEPMLAQARVQDGGAQFILGDAADYAFDRPFDLIFSRFGVMFFADPTAAFAHLRAALKPDGRLVFSAWCAREENTWITTPLAALDLPPAFPTADPAAPGQFAFADGARVERLLRQAGFASVAMCRLDTLIRMGSTPEEAADEALNSGELARQTARLSGAERAPIRARLTRLMARYAGPHGIALPGRAWLVRAN